MTTPESLVFVSDLRRVGLDDRSLRAARAQGANRFLRRGAYSTAVRTDPDTEYDLRIHAVVGTRRYGLVLSHYSAARVWGLPLVNLWPWEVHATEPSDTNRRSKNGVVIHRHDLAESDLVERDGLTVTSLERTLVDLARVAPMRDSVTAIDAALNRSLTIKAKLLDTLSSLGAIDGRAGAGRAIEFASPLAQLPGESLSRVLMHELGFPAPTLQHRVMTARGPRFLDFWWDGIRSGGEFDGRSKYVDPQFTHGRSSDEVMWDEKLRENDLRDAGVRSMARWGWTDLVDVTPFIHRLEVLGLRRARPRGYGSARFGG